jgi:esterase/lipase superfamily enzyme
MIARTYHKWFSPILEKEMEFLVFGETGTPVIFFPTRSAHFYDFENWKIIDALSEKIVAGEIQVFCVDSLDCESFYSNATPEKRILRHIQYEEYILEEVIPFIRTINTTRELVAAGCSLGGYHAVNIAFKHPELFSKVVGMSARYDLTTSLPFFNDLFDGYFDDNIYFNMPNRFVAKISDEEILTAFRRMEIILVIGQEDVFLQNNRELSHSLAEREIPHHLYVWGDEAHKPRYWREMVKLYL